MSKIQRYDHWCDTGHSYMEKDDLGDYIEYEDHEREVKSLKQLLAVKDAGMKALEEEVKRLKEALEEIKSYDKGDGCCVYGCDTPTIAKQALEGGEDE